MTECKEFHRKLESMTLKTRGEVLVLILDESVHCGSPQ
jgi:hypothetical protein